MRKLVTSTFITLDGIMQSPGGPTEDASGNFKNGGWLVPSWDDSVGQAMGDVFAKQPEILLGRKTYEIMNAYWPHTDEPGADNMNNAKKYVASRTLDTVDWNNSTLIKGDVATEVAKLKQLDAPELQVHGSANLIQTLLQHNLIDEMHLLIFPVAIGSGKRFFGEGTTPSNFKLVDSKISTTGVIIATYQYNGALQTGSL
ncbi:MAG: dihydrofolate reductase family protein [Chloroflexota bacterium]